MNEKIKEFLKVLFLAIFCTSLLLIGGTYNLVKIYMFNQKTSDFIETDGIIKKRLERIEDSDRTNFDISYEAYGYELDIKADLPSTSRVGQTTKIVYNPNNPLEAYSVESENSTFTSSVVAVAISLVVILLAIITEIKELTKPNKRIEKSKYDSASHTDDKYGKVVVSAVYPGNENDDSHMKIESSRMSLRFSIPGTMDIKDFLESRNDCEKVLREYDLYVDQIDEKDLQQELIKNDKFMDELYEDYANYYEGEEIMSRDDYDGYINKNLNVEVSEINYDGNLKIIGLFCYGYITDSMEELFIHVNYIKRADYVELLDYELNYD